MSYPADFGLDHPRRIYEDLLGAKESLEQEISEANEEDKVLLKGTLMMINIKARDYKRRLSAYC